VPAGGANGDAPHYELIVGGAAARLKVLPREELARHLRGFAASVDFLEGAPQRKADAKKLISHTKIRLGLRTEAEFETNATLGRWFFDTARHNDGFLFVRNSVGLGNGAALVVSMREES